MIETIPNYIIDLNKKLDQKFDKIDNQFKEINGEIIGIKGEIMEMKGDINDIAINTAQNLRDIAIIKENMATKFQLIGSYEV